MPFFNINNVLLPKHSFFMDSVYSVIHLDFGIIFALYGSYSSRFLFFSFLIYIYIIWFVYFWLCWVFIPAQSFLWQRGLPSSCGVWPAHCRGLSLFWSMGSRALRFVAPGLNFSMACGIFMDEGLNPWLLHWQVDSLPPNYQESPIYLFRSQYYFLDTLFRYLAILDCLCRNEGCTRLMEIVYVWMAITSEHQWRSMWMGFFPEEFPISI